MVQNDAPFSTPRESKDGGSVSVASMVESIVGCKWSVRLLQLCAEGHSRPSAFLRACPGLSAKVMNERWRKMTRFGIVRRTVFGEKPPIQVEYLLTPFGPSLLGDSRPSASASRSRRYRNCLRSRRDAAGGDGQRSPNTPMALTAPAVRKSGSQGGRMLGRSPRLRGREKRRALVAEALVERPRAHSPRLGQGDWSQSRGTLLG